MNYSEFLLIFEKNILAISKILLVGFFGYLLAKFKFLKEDHLDVLSYFIINISLPFFIFYNTIEVFSKEKFLNWWIFPLLGIGMFIFTFLIANFLNLIDRNIKEKGEVISLITFQNSGYLPLPLVALLFPQDEATKMFMSIILFNLFFNPLMWSLGVHLLAKNNPLSTAYKNILNPPFLTIIFSLIIANLKIGNLLPSEFLQPIKMVGDCTIPLVILTVGGFLGNLHFSSQTNFKSIIYVIVFKLFIIPLFVLVILNYIYFPKLISILLIIQASMPPAMNLSIISRMYGGNSLFTNQTIFWTYIISIFSVPLFLTAVLYKLQGI